jgi:hypothetical protein
VLAATTDELKNKNEMKQNEWPNQLVGINPNA